LAHLGVAEWPKGHGERRTLGPSTRADVQVHVAVAVKVHLSVNEDPARRFRGIRH
jgi:hypothetical protein